MRPSRMQRQPRSSRAPLLFHVPLLLLLCLYPHSHSLVDAATQKFLRTPPFNNNNTTPLHPRDQRRRDLAFESRVVGGNVVNDMDKHPFFAEWNGQYCGGAVRHGVVRCSTFSSTPCHAPMCLPTQDHVYDLSLSCTLLLLCNYCLVLLLTSLLTLPTSFSLYHVQLSTHPKPYTVDS